jgi:hypothetical protein
VLSGLRPYENRVGLRKLKSFARVTFLHGACEDGKERTGFKSGLTAKFTVG